MRVTFKKRFEETEGIHYAYIYTPGKGDSKSQIQRWEGARLVRLRMSDPENEPQLMRQQCLRMRPDYQSPARH